MVADVNIISPSCIHIWIIRSSKHVISSWCTSSTDMIRILFERYRRHCNFKITFSVKNSEKRFMKLIFNKIVKTDSGNGFMWCRMVLKASILRWSDMKTLLRATPGLSNLSDWNTTPCRTLLDRKSHMFFSYSTWAFERISQ